MGVRTMMISTTSMKSLFMMTSLVCLASPMGWWRPRDVIDHEQLCSPEFCFGLEYKYVADMYSGIFQTRREIMQKVLQQRWNKRSQTYVPSDGDYFCPTRQRQASRSRLENTKGITKDIVHMDFLDPPRYQFVPYVKADECIKDGVGCRDVMKNTCQTTNITVELLVYKKRNAQITWPWEWPFEFDLFEVPAYCSCLVKG